MQEKLDRYHALFESCGDALLVFDRDKFLDCNPRALDLFGCQQNEIVGCSFSQFFPKEQPDGSLSLIRFSEYIDRALGGERITFDWWYCQLDGTDLATEITLSSTSFDGQKKLLASVRQLEARTHRTQELVNREIRAQQIQKMDSLGLMAGGIAHDFNNFLLAIMGNADLLDHDLKSGLDGQNLLDEIRLAASRAADMCNQLLAFAGKGHCTTRSVDLSAITREMVRMLQVGIPRQVTLRLDLDEHLPCIDADASQLQQVIMNLVINASESMGRSEGSISLSTGEHFCEAENFDHCLRSETYGGIRHLYVEVTDTGSGMDRETIQRICDPFYTSKLHNRGLGMASVLGIVRAHQGTLCIRSKPGEGTCVRACFPVIEAAISPDVSLSQAAVATEGKGLVLVVDDEEILRVLCGRMLSRLGYEVVMAASGQEALDIYRERAEEISCVMLDLIMPGMDGVEVHEKLTAMDPEALVIMTSGYHKQEIASRFEGRGMAGFIQKPYRFASLAEIMGSVIQSSKAGN